MRTRVVFPEFIGFPTVEIPEGKSTHSTKIFSLMKNLFKYTINVTGLKDSLLGISYMSLRYSLSNNLVSVISRVLIGPRLIFSSPT